MATKITLVAWDEGTGIPICSAATVAAQAAVGGAEESTPTPTATLPAETPAPTTPAATEEPTATPSPTDAPTATPSPDADEDRAEGGNDGLGFVVAPPDEEDSSGDSNGETGIITLANFPATASDVLVAENVFQNRIGLGTQGWLAEPGANLVGSGEPQSTIDNAGGYIEYLSADNQISLTDEDGEDRIALDEDQTIVFTGRNGCFSFTLSDAKFCVSSDEPEMWHVIVRGDFDDNQTMVVSDYVAGHSEVLRFPAGAAFISEDGFLQRLNMASTANTSNCDGDGCTVVHVLFVDLNTKAWTYITYKSGVIAFRESNWFFPEG